jgi:hypothetical protein
MRHLVDSATQSMASGNWYAALAAVLTLPDICANLESGEQGNGNHYMDWCRRFAVPIYADRYNVGFPENEIYALRCAFLHQGSGEVHKQKVSKHFDSYLFVLPKKGFTFATRIRHPSELIIEIATFCSVMVEATEVWIETVMNKNPDIQKRSASGVLIITDSGVEGIPL